MENSIMENPVVILESPYSGDIPRNIAYAQRCMADSRLRGEITLVPHLLWTQHHLCPDHFVSDYDPKYELKQIGRDVSLEQIHVLRRLSQMVVFYFDYGLSSGMNDGLKLCKFENIPHEIRTIGTIEADVQNANNRCKQSDTIIKLKIQEDLVQERE